MKRREQCSASLWYEGTHVMAMGMQRSWNRRWVVGENEQRKKGLTNSAIVTEWLVFFFYMYQYVYVYKSECARLKKSSGLFPLYNCILRGVPKYTQWHLRLTSPILLRYNCMFCVYRFHFVLFLISFYRYAYICFGYLVLVTCVYVYMCIGVTLWFCCFVLLFLLFVNFVRPSQMNIWRLHVCWMHACVYTRTWLLFVSISLDMYIGYNQFL